MFSFFIINVFEGLNVMGFIAFDGYLGFCGFRVLELLMITSV